jgi:hypothetical protein
LDEKHNILEHKGDYPSPTWQSTLAYFALIALVAIAIATFAP